MGGTARGEHLGGYRSGDGWRVDEDVVRTCFDGFNRRDLRIVHEASHGMDALAHVGQPAQVARSPRSAPTTHGLHMLRAAEVG